VIPSANTIRILRAKRQITIPEIATFVNVDEDVVRAWETTGADRPIGKGQVARLAGLLNVPQFALFDDDYVDDIPEVFDYRSVAGRKAKLDEASGRVIRYLKEVQEFTKFLAAEVRDRSKVREIAAPDLKDLSPEQGAQSYVANIGLRLDHLLNAPYDFTAYEMLRRKVEGAGVTVLQSSLSDASIKGACLYDDDAVAPIVWINTFRQNSTSRMFSLLHEVCHVLSGHSGVSSTYITDNNLEAHCNKFAANVLLPRQRFSAAVHGLSARLDVPSNAMVNALAKEFVASKHAIVIRMVDLGLVPRGFLAQWLAQFAGKPLPEEIPTIAIPAERDEGRRKLAMYGYRLARYVKQGLVETITTPIEVFETIKLKPQYLYEWLRAVDERNVYLASLESD
jgi:Zn-dependent peptidase ImmA (M78 family)/transcriptional regulator with XRE-family HTH domain